MKKSILLISLFFPFFVLAQLSWQGGATPEANQSATLLFDKAGTPLAGVSGNLYAHTGVNLDGTDWQNVIGTWGSTAQPQFTLVSGTTYKLELTPTIMAFYGVTAGTISKLNIVVRNEAGNLQTVDLEIEVGAFQAELTNPYNNATVIVTNGGTINVTGTASQNATFTLSKDAVMINTFTGTTYNYALSGITENSSYLLEIENNGIIFTNSFNVLVAPTTTTAALPANVEDGINYNATDPTKATLVLDAPFKDFVYVAGSFNDYTPTAAYAMKKDPTSSKFWLELTGLTSGQIETYQYWVVDQTPIANSPELVKTADPFSTLVLSPFDDPFIPASSYPNMPSYPAGQEREVTVLQTGQTAYNWQVTDFIKPAKEKLIIYELLVRDFDADRNYQNIIDRIDYFVELGINAIELMPIMEFEGNESWGYNTSFHMALDKFYGTEEKFKEMIDLCHQNGIAVILDLALNHSFGRNPMIRIWMNDPNNDGWGSPSSENPYYNEVAKHSYSVGEDFNHQQPRTKNYTKRVIKHWIEEFNIDGFRWDLTKGFTQNCTANDGNCTNTYQQDRVDVLKEYADYSWSLDNDHYVIFEHLGGDNEEQQWANYKLNEGKGIMMWGEMYTNYKQLAQGYNSNANIGRMTSASRGFTAHRLIGYPESHDKDRMVYEAKTYGNSGGTDPATNLNNAISRMSAIGAMSLLVPGPKMIWHFAELGHDDSIYTCNDGSVNTENDAAGGDCKLDTKPQPQWVENWVDDATRSVVFDNYKRLISLKKLEPVFDGNVVISPDGGNNVKQRMYISDDTLPATQLKNVVVLANFSVATVPIVANFPYTGTWYNLMDHTPLTVDATNMQISIPAGGFRVYGNQTSTLSTTTFEETELNMYPNPATNTIAFSKDINTIVVYTISGQKVMEKTSLKANENISVSSLTKGIYMVVCTSKEGNTSYKKLIKE